MYTLEHASFLEAASCGDLDVFNHYMPLRDTRKKWEAFSLAAQNGHLNIVKSCLEHYRDHLDFFKICCGVSPLHLAVKEGHLEVVQAIVEFLRPHPQLIDTKLRPQWWEGIIALAVLYNHSQIVLRLVTNPLIEDRLPLLLALAAHKGHLDTFKALIGISSNGQLLQHTDDGLTVLHLAAQSGCASEEVLQLLIDHGIVNFNVRSSPDLFTPLHMAANSGQADVVGFLLRSSGVDPMARDCMRRTPLHYAAREGHVQVVQLFLQNNPQAYAVDFTDSDGLTPLHMAARGGHVEVIEILLKPPHGFNIMSACKHSVNLRRLFNISFGSCRFFGSPLSAIRFPRPKLIDSLFWRTGGFTPLHFAARYGHHEAVKILLKERARIRNDHAQNSARFQSYELPVTQNQENMFQEVYLQLEKAEFGSDVPKLIMQIGCMNSSNVNIAMREVIEESQAMEMLQYPWEGPLPITILSQSQADLFNSQEVCAIECIMDKEWAKLCIKDDNYYLFEGEVEQGMQSNGRHFCLHWAACTGDVRWVERLLAHKNIDINVKDELGRTALDLALKHCNIEAATELLLHPNMKLNDFPINYMQSLLQIERLSIKKASERVRSRRQRLWENLLLAFLKHPNKGQNVAQLKPLLSMARKNGLMDVERMILDHSELKKSLFEDRKMYLDCANAILVGAALIAAVAYQGWLQPPLGYSFKDELEDTPYTDVDRYEAVRYFWWFNSFAFFFSMTSLIAGAIGAMPVVKRMDILKSAEKAKKAVAVASVMLGMAVMCVVVAFSVAGFGVVPRMPNSQQIMRVSVGCGATICSVVLIWFWKRLWPLFLELFPFLCFFLEPISLSHLETFQYTMYEAWSSYNDAMDEEKRATKVHIPYFRAYCTIIVGYLLFLLTYCLQAIGLRFEFLNESLYWISDKSDDLVELASKDVS